MNDMNGHEGADGKSHQASAGFHAYSANEPTTVGLTNQQIVILGALRRGESITPWVARSHYGCKSLSSVISALREKGWGIDTNRRRDRAGNRFPSYRLWRQYVKSDHEEGHGPLFGEVSQNPDPVPDLPPAVTECVEEDLAELDVEPPVPDVVPEPAQEEESPTARARNSDIVREHLISQKTISPRTAMDLYRLPANNLRAIVSKLRSEEKLPIATVRVTNEAAHYTLIDLPDDADDAEVQTALPGDDQKEVAEMAAASEIDPSPEETRLVPEPKSTRDPCTFFTVTGVWRAKDGVELGLEREEGHGDKPLHKISFSDAEYILMSLRHLLDTGTR